MCSPGVQAPTRPGSQSSTPGPVTCRDGVVSRQPNQQPGAFSAKGDDARLFRDYANLTDPVRGLYLDKTSIAFETGIQKIFKGLSVLSQGQTRKRLCHK